MTRTRRGFGTLALSAALALAGCGGVGGGRPTYGVPDRASGDAEATDPGGAPGDGGNATTPGAGTAGDDGPAPETTTAPPGTGAGGPRGRGVDRAAGDTLYVGSVPPGCRGPVRRSVERFPVRPGDVGGLRAFLRSAYPGLAPFDRLGRFRRVAYGRRTVDVRARYDPGEYRFARGRGGEGPTFLLVLFGDGPTRVVTYRPPECGPDRGPGPGADPGNGG